MRDEKRWRDRNDAGVSRSQTPDSQTPDSQTQGSHTLAQLPGLDQSIPGLIHCQLLSITSNDL